MITIENRVGRLIELRQTGQITFADLQENGTKFQKILSKMQQRAVMCTDWRGMLVLAPNVADTLLAIMQADNNRIEYQAVLLDTNAIIGLQLERLFRQAGSGDRATFTSVSAMEAALAKFLTIPERERARRFLSTRSAAETGT